jgi:hypothetical protein
LVPDFEAIADSEKDEFLPALIIKERGGTGLVSADSGLIVSVNPAPSWIAVVGRGVLARAPVGRRRAAKFFICHEPCRMFSVLAERSRPPGERS